MSEAQVGHSEGAHTPDAASGGLCRAASSDSLSPLHSRTPPSHSKVTTKINTSSTPNIRVVAETQRMWELSPSISELEDLSREMSATNLSYDNVDPGTSCGRRWANNFIEFSLLCGLPGDTILPGQIRHVLEEVKV
jgi:hypothetical protein